MDSCISIISVAIAVVGWLANHFLGIKAQEKAFLNQIANEARLTIAKVLRGYQSWLGTMVTEAEGFWNHLFGTGSGTPHDRLRSYREAFGQSHSTEWVIVLEEYEILFPESREVRIQLLERHRKLIEMLNQNRANYDRSLLGSIREYAFDQAALVEDLRIYFQNRVLGRITGNTVPARRPSDSSVPKVVLKDGRLTVTAEHPGRGEC